jgi:diguanylate cyclase (GGDEF)-like protein
MSDQVVPDTAPAGPWSPSHRAVLWVVNIAGVAVFVWAAAGGVSNLDVFPSRAYLAMVVAVVLSYCGSRWPVSFRFRSERVDYTWPEVGFMLAVALYPHPALVAATAAGVWLAGAQRRVPLKKLAYNVSQNTVSCAVALGVARLIGGAPLDPQTVRGAVAVFLCGLVYALGGEFFADLAISTVQRVPFLDVARVNVLLDQYLLFGNLLVGTAVAVVGTESPAVFVLLPVGVLVVRRIHYSAVRMRQHDQGFRDLQSATEMLSRLDGREVLEALVTGAARLCRAELVEVVLADGSVLRGDEERVRPAAEVTHLPYMTTASLEAGGRHLGEVRLRFAKDIKLTEAERRALSTLAAVGGVAIVNARQHERTIHDATHDPLTDLYNRRALMLALEEALSRDAEGVALFVVDLDRFKEINDTLGHSAGDAVLRVVGDRLCSRIGADGVVGRLGGDEFAVLLPAASPMVVAAVSERIRAALGGSVALETPGGGEVTVTVAGSVGVATPATCDDPSGARVSAMELLRRADVAMYRAKAAGGGTAHYDAGSDPTNLQRLLLEPELRAAVGDPAQIVVEYQPQYDFGSGTAVGAEALVRWRHPVYGMLKPDVVLPAVERCGLDRPLTIVVLDRALAARNLWAREYDVDVRVAVNVSPRTMLDRTFPASVQEALARHRTRPDRLLVDVPETVAVSDLDAVADVIGGLHELGVQIALDDFGTGGAPLTLLARMPVDEVKIDRSFVGDIARNRTAEAIVRASVDLARALGIRTVAKGVETTSVDQVLRGLGCDAAQGYRYGRPVDEDSAGALMQDAQKEARMRTSAGVVRLAGVRRRPRI